MTHPPTTALEGGGRPRVAWVPLVALAGLVAALVVARYYPFDWDPPRLVDNEVVRTSEDALSFHGENTRALTWGPHPWLDAARAEGISVRLTVKPDPEQAHSMASMVMLAQDYWHTDFAIGQDGRDVLIWLRRPGSNENGDPPFRVDDVLSPTRWTTLEILVEDDLSVSADGVVKLTERLPGDALQDWAGGALVLGNEVRGGGAWLGQMRQAEVTGGTSTVDYVAPGEINIPDRYFYFPDRVAPFPPQSRVEWQILPGHLLTFVVLGFLLVNVRRPRISPQRAIAIAVAASLLMFAVKMLFHGRHASFGDVVFQTAGACIGVALAQWGAQSQRFSSRRKAKTLPELNQQ